MKKIFALLLVGVWLMGVVSCSDDDEPAQCPVVDDEEEVLMTDQSNVTLVNTKDIVVGAEDGDDVVFQMNSTVMTAEGRVPEATLNCCGMGALSINYEENKMDTTTHVENVTLINRGTITVHTKYLVERYQEQLQTLEDKNRPYTYFRILVMYAGERSTVINEGTINVYFDHDPSTTSTVYAMGMVAGEGSYIINNGQINFYGQGSVATRFRGMATFGNNISAFNNGVMTAEMDMVEDARMITTGGTQSNVINDGIMRMRLPGKVLCMTRYGDSNLINNNLIDITSVGMPEGYESIVTDEDHIVCAMYEPLQATRTGMPSMVNRGTINITIDESAASEPLTQGYGMFCDLMGAKAEQLEVNIINDGSINLKQNASVHFNMAEAGFVARKIAAAGACSIKLGRWHTTLRDFAQTRDLFLGKGVNMDFSGGELLLDYAADYVDGTSYSVAPEALLYDAGEGDFRYEYSGYRGLKFSAADASVVVDWDRSNRQVSLQKSN